MNMIEREPIVSVGLMSGVDTASFELKGDFIGVDGERFKPGIYRAIASSGLIEVAESNSERRVASAEWSFVPAETSSSFLVRDVTIGIDFHWQRKQDQEFRGALRLIPGPDGKLIVLNEIPVESYLISVISSEMSADSHPELLKAHSIISRSWLLAQLNPWKKPRNKPASKIETIGDSKQLIRWYDQESHIGFDVCADDHCQRYQGIARATSRVVSESVNSTFGQVLTYRGELCDARFSKSCGGMTESFSAAWEDRDVPYLAVSYDGESFPAGFALPLNDEVNAGAWIRNSPPSFCNTGNPRALAKILPDFDRETTDFYRWRVIIEQQELQDLLHRKLGIDFGAVLSLEPIERGRSGRLIKLKIVGEREKAIIGKELEIRRALSPSHLYSSAFIVDADRNNSGVPERFLLTGAGWGHGVGLCQIGAALMAERGYNHRRILEHYYRGSGLSALYSGAA
jgi:peptidoglycan hydrolase-like amidase